jgi:hypothetical protein
MYCGPRTSNTLCMFSLLDASFSLSLSLSSWENVGQAAIAQTAACCMKMNFKRRENKNLVCPLFKARQILPLYQVELSRLREEEVTILGII